MLAEIDLLFARVVANDINHPNHRGTSMKAHGSSRNGLVARSNHLVTRTLGDLIVSAYDIIGDDGIEMKHLSQCVANFLQQYLQGHEATLTTLTTEV